MSRRVVVQPGCFYYPGFLDAEAQRALAALVVAGAGDAPFFTPAMPRTGKPFSVRMTNFGALGWVSDRDGGYRYQPTHPETGRPWPPIPEMVLAVWRAVADYPHDPEACLVNYYAPGARMGLHQDRDEAGFRRAGGLASPSAIPAASASAARRAAGRPASFRLASGDVVVLGGPARLAFHGVDRLYPGTSTLLSGWFPEGGRINLTLRRVTEPAG